MAKPVFPTKIYIYSSRNGSDSRPSSMLLSDSGFIRIRTDEQQQQQQQQQQHLQRVKETIQCATRGFFLKKSIFVNHVFMTVYVQK